MNNIKILMTVCIIITLFIGCATPAKSPEFIGPIRISPVKYTFYNCGQIEQEYNWLVKELYRLTGVQSKVANIDKTLVLVSLFIVPVPLMGGHSSVELGLIKGNIEAIENAVVNMDCGQIKRTILKNKEVRISNKKTMEELLKEKEKKKMRKSGKAARRRISR